MKRPKNFKDDTKKEKGSLERRKKDKVKKLTPKRSKTGTLLQSNHPKFSKGRRMGTGMGKKIGRKKTWRNRFHRQLLLQGSLQFK